MRRSGHRLSVLHYLLALALVPTVAMPVFAGFFAKSHLDEASAAQRIGDAMTMVTRLDDLRGGIGGEGTASGLKSMGAKYGLTLEQLDEIMGGTVPIRVPEARARTDRALSAIEPDAETKPQLDEFRAVLRAARRTADETFADTEDGADPGWKTYESFQVVHQMLADIQNDAINRVVTGQFGTGSSELLTTMSQLQRVAATVDVGKRRATFLQGIFSATTPDQRASVLAELREISESWRMLSRELPSHLSDDMAASWRKLIDNPEVKAFDDFIDQMVQASPEVEPGPATPGATESARTARVMTDALSRLVKESVAEGVGVAHSDQAAAEGRARIALGTTLLLLLVTVALAAYIGGTIRARLSSLATAAERFSGGRLEAMAVRGPREIAMASAALNDAVASLQRVATQAERLSAGDLDSPELAESAPGALGLAVHSSVQCIVSAVREGEKLREALAHQAAHDDLTDLPNRAETERLLEGALARARRGDTRVAVLFVDLDHFKRCNDTLGHAAGDHVLRTAATRMSAAVRPGDTVCRIGGDEFVVVVEPVGTDRSLFAIAQRIVTALAEPVAYGDSAIVIGGSIGVAVSHRASDAGSLLREADSAMYLAKATARGSVELFNDDLRADIQRDADFRTAMSDGLARGELELHYQPVLDIASGELRSLEALARWQRPGFGMVPPNDFIPMAEASDLIVDIGCWALNAATAQLMLWSADPLYAPIQVAVNLSGRHLAQQRVVNDVRSALRSSGLEPGRLIVEITESIAIDHPATIEHLRQLADMGVLIALDDFGTGYTSIGQLLHLPVHILKIDRSFVSGTNEDGSGVLEGSTRIIDLIIEVAHSLDLGVVAEGVEEPSQLAKLEGADCEAAQGYLFSKPLPVDKVAAWVTTHNAEARTDAGTRSNLP